jgi:hypothetical protein
MPPNDGGLVCSTAGTQFGFCELVCYKPGESGTPAGPCLAFGSPALKDIPAFKPQACGLKALDSGPYCPPQLPAGSCCYLAVSEPCAGRPLHVGNTTRLAPLTASAWWA